MTVLTGELLASFDDSGGPVDEARLLHRQHWPANGA